MDGLAEMMGSPWQMESICKELAPEGMHKMKRELFHSILYFSLMYRSWILKQHTPGSNEPLLNPTRLIPLIWMHFPCY